MSKLYAGVEVALNAGVRNFRSFFLLLPKQITSIHIQRFDWSIILQ